MGEVAGWLAESRPAAALHCAWCDRDAAFAHMGSLRTPDGVWHLHRCPGCASLAYDAPVLLPRPPQPRRAALLARYYREVGCPLDAVLTAALASLGGRAADLVSAPHGLVFVQMNGGVGVGGEMMRALFGLPVVDVAGGSAALPSGATYGKRALVLVDGLLPGLADPLAELQTLRRLMEVETLALLLPDAGAPTTGVVPLERLAPGDARSVPSRHGATALLRRAGFAHVDAMVLGGMLVAAGSDSPLAMPEMRAVGLARVLALERMVVSGDPAAGMAALCRLLPRAVAWRQADALALLAPVLARLPDPAGWLDRLARPQWDDIPFGLDMLAHWLGVAANEAGRAAEAAGWRQVGVAFAARMEAEFPALSDRPRALAQAGGRAGRMAA